MNYLETALLLKSKDNILIFTHARPDGDTIGSARALCLSLRALGKEAYVFPNEDAHALFIPYMEDVMAPSSFSADFFVSVDTASAELLTPSALSFREKIDLSIDHHGSNTNYAKKSCISPSFAACGELLYLIVKELGPITADIANALYLAISTDTGCFSFSSTTPQTHRITAELMEMGCNMNDINKVHFRTKSLARLRMESMLVDEMLMLDEGRIAIVSILNDMIASVNATEADLENIAAFLELVEGVEIAVTIREVSTDHYKISLRTNGTLNASTVCGKLGGGGHPAAAGCKISGKLDEVKDAIMQAITDTKHETT